jgi:hypothetical protein
MPSSPLFCYFYPVGPVDPFDPLTARGALTVSWTCFLDISLRNYSFALFAA